LIAFYLVILFRKLVILRLGAFEGRVGHDIPCVVDANEQEQHRAWKMTLKSGSAETPRKRCRFGYMLYLQPVADELTEGAKGAEHSEKKFYSLLGVGLLNPLNLKCGIC
jgi:hypothetical protein